jgi:outer membrane protein
MGGEVSFNKPAKLSFYLECHRRDSATIGFVVDHGGPLMANKFLIVLVYAVLANAEIHRLTLNQVLEIASKQNPDILLARLDAERADQGTRTARDPFVPKVSAGSGLAYTYGYPGSIDGNAPSIVEVRTSMAIFNRSQSYQVAEARETVRGARIDTQAKTDEALYQTATMFLDALDREKRATLIERDEPVIMKLVETMQARVVLKTTCKPLIPR